VRASAALGRLVLSARQVSCAKNRMVVPIACSASSHILPVGDVRGSLVDKGYLVFDGVVPIPN